MSDNNNWPGKPGVREKLEYALAMHFANNRMPHMSGDPRNRLSSLQRRNMEDAVTSILEVIGPCLTPAEVDARVKEARRDALEEAAQIIDDSARRCTEGGISQRILESNAAAIRALKGEGDV
jgi:hypothetical protein